jgi:hypothetical protein
MGAQLPTGRSRGEQAAIVLNVLAALCDRTAYPALEGATDVEDGDRRCGAYLK